MAPSGLVGILCSHPPSRESRIAQLQLPLRIQDGSVAAELSTRSCDQQMAKTIVLLHHALAFCNAPNRARWSAEPQFSQAYPSHR